MTIITSEGTVNVVPFRTEDRPSTRRPSYGDDPTVLADIYRDDVNIAIWQRTIRDRLGKALESFLAAGPQFEKLMTVTPDSAYAAVIDATNGSAPLELADDVAQLVDIFCYLFDRERAGLRLATLDRAMCPRFHVDRIPCRLITTYHGVATEWIPHEAVEYSKPSPGSKRQSGFGPGLSADESETRRLTSGDVALLKGALWAGNEDCGLVHRSPAVPAGESRLMLSLDFCD